MKRHESPEARHGARQTGPGARGHGVIYADPPWRTLSLAEIKALPVAGIAAKDCILFLWAPQAFLGESLEVVAAWGFLYRTGAVWDKEEHTALGDFFMEQHELLLIARRGKPGTPPPSLRQRSVYREKPGKHSEKPEWFIKTIEDYYPSAKRIDLFARQARPGWAVWGDEVEQRDG